MAAAGAELECTKDAIADAAVEVIGARRLSTVTERVLDEISFEASDKARTKFTIDSNYVQKILIDIQDRLEPEGESQKGRSRRDSHGLFEGSAGPVDWFIGRLSGQRTRPTAVHPVAV